MKKFGSILGVKNSLLLPTCLPVVLMFESSYLKGFIDVDNKFGRVTEEEDEDAGREEDRQAGAAAVRTGDRVVNYCSPGRRCKLVILYEKISILN